MMNDDYTDDYSDDYTDEFTDDCTDDYTDHAPSQEASIMLPDGRPAPPLSRGNWWVALQPFCDDPKRRSSPTGEHVVKGLYWKWIVAMKLYHVDGFSYEQIAPVCGHPKGHVQRMIRKTRKRLSEALDIKL